MTCARMHNTTHTRARGATPIYEHNARGPSAERARARGAPQVPLLGSLLLAYPFFKRNVERLVEKGQGKR